MAAQKGAQASLVTLEAVVDVSVRDNTTAPGFRHFLGTPRPSQRFKVDGIDPLCAPAHLPVGEPGSAPCKKENKLKCTFTDYIGVPPMILKPFRAVAPLPSIPLIP